MKKIKLILFGVIFLLGIYSYWSQTGRAVDPAPPNLHLQEIAEYGANTQRGNFLGIQPYVLPEDYASEEKFAAKIDGYLNAAYSKRWLNEKTVVVLPEYIGTWLVVAGEKQSVYRAQNVERGLQTLVASNLFSFLKAWLFAKANDRVKDSVFRMKAATMARIYQKVFSHLAKKYAVTIVAGSIVLPSPRVEQGKLAIGEGELYNVAVVYKPDGTAHDQLIRKIFPIADELPFTKPASAAELPVFETPAGKLGVLICADSWYPSTYSVLQAQQAELVAVPSYLTPDSVWGKFWRGYSGAPAPADVDINDVNKITEGEAWLKYALAGRMRQANLKHGINVFLRGQLWDLGSDGHTIIANDSTVVEAKHVAGAAIICRWL